ncbi:MAG: hypothetical protein R2814_18205 [Flavobacteriaceae bacterium]
MFFHFGTTGYLGLEQDIRLKAAVDAIQKYGTQFPLSILYLPSVVQRSGRKIGQQRAAHHNHSKK